MQYLQEKDLRSQHHITSNQINGRSYCKNHGSKQDYKNVLGYGSN
jgi:hypothetical protein